MSAAEERQIRRELGLELVDHAQPYIDDDAGLLVWDTAAMADQLRPADWYKPEPYGDRRGQRM